MFFKKIKLIMNDIESELEDIEYFSDNLNEESRKYQCENNKINRLGVEIMLVLFFINIYAVYYFLNAKEVSVLNNLFANVNLLGFFSLIVGLGICAVLEALDYLRRFILFLKKIFEKTYLKCFRWEWT